jgi:hypothetical protein
VGSFQTVPIGSIRTDGGTQIRVDINEDAVDQFRADMLGGNRIDPITVCRIDGVLWLVDGFHRVAAARAAGRKDLPAEVISGHTHDDAVLAAIRANRGKPRTERDLFNAVAKLIAIAGWEKKSAREMATYIGCSDKTVAAALHKLSAESPQIVTTEKKVTSKTIPSPTIEVKRGKSTYPMQREKKKTKRDPVARKISPRAKARLKGCDELKDRNLARRFANLPEQTQIGIADIVLAGEAPSIADAMAQVKEGTIPLTAYQRAVANVLALSEFDQERLCNYVLKRLERSHLKIV